MNDGKIIHSIDGEKYWRDDDLTKWCYGTKEGTCGYLPDDHKLIPKLNKMEILKRSEQMTKLFEGNWHKILAIFMIQRETKHFDIDCEDIKKLGDLMDASKIVCIPKDDHIEVRLMDEEDIKLEIDRIAKGKKYDYLIKHRNGFYFDEETRRFHQTDSLATIYTNRKDAEGVIKKFDLNQCEIEER